MIIIETERLALRYLQTSDAPFIFDLLNTPSWIQYIGDRGIKNLYDAQQYIADGPVKSYEKLGYGLFLVKLKSEETPIGICGLIKRDSLDDVDIGFAFLPQFTRKGYAFEAASATLAHAKTALGLNRVVAITLITNTSSINLLKKIGLNFEKMIKFPGDQKELMLFAG